MKNKEGNSSMMSKHVFIRRWLLYRLLPTLIVFIISIYVMKSSMYKSNESVINYEENGNIDYKVYLNDNTYYTDEYLKKGMQYIANLIKKININYNYSFNASEKLDYKYQYMIKSNLIITDPTDNNKIIYSKENILTPETKKDISNNTVIINDSIDIDYQKYNNYVKSFINEYGLEISSKLLITMEINAFSKSNILKSPYNSIKKLILSVPLSEQTLNITTDSNNIISKGTLDKSYKYKIKKPYLLIISIIITIIGLVLLYKAAYELFVGRKKIDLYKSAIDKILKEYDSEIVIVSSDSIESIKEDNYNIINVEEFSELLDAHDSTNQPILYSETIPNELSYFIIIVNNLLYKLKIDRKKVEEKTKNRKLKNPYESEMLDVKITDNNSAEQLIDNDNSSLTNASNETSSNKIDEPEQLIRNEDSLIENKDYIEPKIIEQLQEPTVINNIMPKIKQEENDIISSKISEPVIIDDTVTKLTKNINDTEEI